MCAEDAVRFVLSFHVHAFQKFPAAADRIFLRTLTSFFLTAESTPHLPAEKDIFLISTFNDLWLMPQHR
jgi:hypothetical protein